MSTDRNRAFYLVTFEEKRKIYLFYDVLRGVSNDFKLFIQRRGYLN